MFWAITCESGKRYSQVSEDPFHISMAALEPRDKIPDNKQVSLMVEHKGKEFLLCTLEYDRVMQVNLDLQFSKAEEAYFFISGEGTIHLSGYSDIDTDVPENLADELSDAAQYGATVDEYEDDDESDELGTKRLLTLDDSEEEDSEDWQPEAEFSAKQDGPSRRHVNFVNSDQSVSVDGELDEDAESDNLEEEEDGEELSSADEEMPEFVEEKSRKKKFGVPGTSSKRTRDEASPKKSALSEALNSANKKRKKMKADSKEIGVQGGESLETQITSSDTENDEMNSSIGRTPMPSKRREFLRIPKSTIGSGLKPGASLDRSAKGIKQESVNKSESGTKGDQKYSQKLPCGVEIEDVRVGNGPIAKKGKFAHVFYVGKLSNNKIFDSAKPGSDKPLSFRLGKEEVIKGWDYGIEGMRVGGRRLLKIPPQLAYGKKGKGPIPPNSTLLFTVDLKAVS